MSERPDFIGTYTARGQTHFYAATVAEIDRGAFTLSRVLRSFLFAPGSNVLTISMIPEIIQYGPFERAVQMLGLYGLNADDSPFDAGRVESIARQFDPVAICGVAKSTLEGLAMMGHDPATVFKGRVIWARPDAYDAVAALPGIDARRVVSIGPALGLECADGRVHYDGRDWSVTTEAEQFVISSRTPRLEPVDALNTGIAGSMIDGACSCGTRDAMVQVA